MSFPLYLARRAFLSRRHGTWGRLIGWLATAAMSVGVAALIITLSVMSGFRHDIQSKILGIQPHIIITTTLNSLNPQSEFLNKVLSDLPDIYAYAPYVHGQVLIGASSMNSGAMIKGVDPDFEPKIANLDQKVIEGSWDSLSRSGEKPSIILGTELSRNIGARVGDMVWVVAPDSIKMNVMGIPRAHRFQVGAIIQTGLYDYDSSLAFLHIGEAQKLFEMKTHVSGIGVRLNNPDHAVQFASVLQNQLDGQYWVRSWLSLNKNLFSALKLEKMVMFIILMLITLVASVMIVSNLLLIITQKVKEIGIIRAMGATQATVKKWFIYQGLLMGLIGNVSGIILGVGISFLLSKTNFIRLPADVYYIDHVPVNIILSDVISVSLVSTCVVLIAVIFPASKAAKLDPIEAIRHG